MGQETNESTEPPSSSDQKEQDPQKTVIVGVTGKIDSMLAAFLLKKQGYNCIAISVILSDYRPDMDLPKNDPPIFGSCYIEEMDRIKQLCEVIKIPFYGANAQSEHRDQITDLAIEARLDGQEFNPYPYCYKVIIEVLLKKMEYFNADYIATGHHAKISHNQKLNQSHLLEIKEQKYDQSYDLALLDSRHLEKLILPLSELNQSKINKMAKSLNIDFIKKTKEDSLFFTRGDKFSKFIEGRVAKSLLAKGHLYNYGNAMAMGDHEGTHYYYLGQKDLTVRLPNTIDSEYQVIEINLPNGVVFVNMEMELKYTHCYLRNFKPDCNLDMSRPLRVFIKTSTYAKKIPASVFFKNNQSVLIQFEKEQKGLLPPGHIVVLYGTDESGSKLLGRGIIRFSGIFRGARITHLPKLETEEEDNSIKDTIQGNVF